MMPGTLSIITDAFPPEERGKAMGTWAGVSALALAVGPVLGGFLTEHVSWRAIFYLNIPVAIGAILATTFAVRESRDTSVGKDVDFAGVAALTVGLTALVLALVEGNSWGWGSAGIVALIAASATALVGFVFIEQRVKAPMVQFDLLSDRNFLGAVVVALIITFAMMGVFFFLALYMQNILHYSPLEAGVRFLPSTLMIVTVAPISGRLADRYGPRWLIVGGLLLLTASLLTFTQIAVDSTYLALLPGFMLLGIGIALTMSPMTSAAMNAVPVQKAGIASGVLSMFRMVGGSLGIAVSGAIFQGTVGSSFETATPQQFVDGLSSAMAVSAGVTFIGVFVGALAIRAKGKAVSVEAAEAAVNPGGSSVAAAEVRPDLAVASH
jgi:EmrB/QacA subfamily drug resistance transporter